MPVVSLVFPDRSTILYEETRDFPEIVYDEESEFLNHEETEDSRRTLEPSDFLRVCLKSPFQNKNCVVLFSSWWNPLCSRGYRRMLLLFVVISQHLTFWEMVTMMTATTFLSCFRGCIVTSKLAGRGMIFFTLAGGTNPTFGSGLSPESVFRFSTKAGQKRLKLSLLLRNHIGNSCYHVCNWRWGWNCVCTKGRDMIPSILYDLSKKETTTYRVSHNFKFFSTKRTENHVKCVLHWIEIYDAS